MAATRNPRLRLLHIRDEIEGLSVALKGVTFERYRESYTLRRVTERALQIISEAARALPAELTDKHSRRPGMPSSASATSCGTNISIWTIAAYGRS
jgi:uncharacterized protein with HEPN domain